MTHNPSKLDNTVLAAMILGFLFLISLLCSYCVNFDPFCLIMSFSPNLLQYQEVSVSLVCYTVCTFGPTSIKRFISSPFYLSRVPGRQNTRRRGKKVRRMTGLRCGSKVYIGENWINFPNCSYKWYIITFLNINSLYLITANTLRSWDKAAGVSEPPNKIIQRTFYQLCAS